MGIPIKQQGTSTWNFGSNENGTGVHTLPEIARVASSIGMEYLDLLQPDELPGLERLDFELKVASIIIFDVDGKGNPPFLIGPNNPKSNVIFPQQMQKLIRAADNSNICKRITTFFGDEREDPFDESNTKKIPLEDGIDNCVKAYKGIIKMAEDCGVVLVLELLNDIDRGHPMKGHPHYQGNRLYQCLEVIKRVDSPSLKLLFDIYHIGLMEPSKTPADWIRTLGTDVIGHVHTAGHNYREEIVTDTVVDHQDCMAALIEIGYDGPVIHEYLPTIYPIRLGLEKSAKVLSGELQRA